MREICLFPLHTVLFPGMPLPLHIFEARYRLMIQRCISENQPFGVVLIRQGLEALGPLAKPYTVGCTANIVQAERLEDGRLNILTLGEERFKIHSLSYELPYLTATVEIYPMEEPHTIAVARGVRNFQPWIFRYLQTLNSLSDEELHVEIHHLDLPEDPLVKLYMAASLLQIPLHEKQDLLESETTAHLLYKLTRLYRREISVINYQKKSTSNQANISAWLN